MSVFLVSEFVCVVNLKYNYILSFKVYNYFWSSLVICFVRIFYSKFIFMYFYKRDIINVIIIGNVAINLIINLMLR